MKPLIFLSLLLIGSPVFGCDSYEDCLKYSNQSRDHQNYNEAKFEVLKAIAYKLDEISKKLDKPESPIKKQNWIYRQYIDSSRVYVTTNGTDIKQYDYLPDEYFNRQIGERHATDEEIEAFWKKAHPEWYKK